MDYLIPSLLVSIVAVGMALAFLSADRGSATSRALALALAATGLSIFLNGYWVPAAHRNPSWSGWLALPETLALIAMLEWLLRVRRMVPVPEEFDTRTGDWLLRLGQLGALVYQLFALLWPELRISQFLHSTSFDAVKHGGFWLFATPVLFTVLSGLGSLLLLLNRKPEVAERIRLIAFAGAVPFCVAGLVLPADLGPISIIVGEMILLVGAVHYHVLQGQRGFFLSRFLSPEVARLVSHSGLHVAMRESQLTLSVVACDLRGFSRFAREVPSGGVIQILREYYDAVGEVAARYGGTIKDYAGDGVLVLVGAPIALPDHASRALDLAAGVRDAVERLVAQWARRDGPPLGIGVGVATGTVTVGVIGGRSRLEYTAVGAAVNLACRLCEQAQDGEILIDLETLRAGGAAQARPRPAVALKGFGEPVVHFGV